MHPHHCNIFPFPSSNGNSYNDLHRHLPISSYLNTSHLQPPTDHDRTPPLPPPNHRGIPSNTFYAATHRHTPTPPAAPPSPPTSVHTATHS
uniref:Uncharacterized protein n=1 Tax=Arundo donax TaxID=35708 RepID=A0A0A9D625_ARUDO